MHSVLGRLVFDIVRILPRYDIAEGRKLIRLVDGLADDGLSLGVQVGFGVLHEAVVHVDLGQVLILDQPHHIPDVLLAEFIDILVVFESIQDRQGHLQRNPRENDVYSADLQDDSEQLNCCLRRELRVHRHVQEELKVRGVEGEVV